MRHACLVTDKRSQMWGEGGIILGEGSNAATMVLGSLLRKILQRPMTGSLELSMRHFSRRPAKNMLSLHQQKKWFKMDTTPKFIVFKTNKKNQLN